MYRQCDSKGKPNPNGRCTAKHSDEIAMVFDEKPNAPLVLNDSIVSQNPTAKSSQAPKAATFQSPLSKLTPFSQEVRLTIIRSHNRTFTDGHHYR